MFWPILEALTKDLEGFQGFDQFQQELERQYGCGEGRRPAVNVHQSDESAVVVAELPGVAPEDIKLRVDGQVLVVEAERKPTDLGEEDLRLKQERVYGAYKRRVRLPFEVEEDKIEAVYKHGVLTVTLPRAEVTRPRTIEIKSV
jgi:HSP20 family molecular chaperone IbpA